MSDRGEEDLGNESQCPPSPTYQPSDASLTHTPQYDTPALYSSNIETSEIVSGDTVSAQQDTQNTQDALSAEGITDSADAVTANDEEAHLSSSVPYSKEEGPSQSTSAAPTGRPLSRTSSEERPFKKCRVDPSAAIPSVAMEETPPDPAKVTKLLEGPAYLKVLVAARAYPKIAIHIPTVEQQSGATIITADVTQIFPGTQDRITKVGGRIEQVVEAHAQLMRLLDAVTNDSEQKNQAAAGGVAPSSSDRSEASSRFIAKMVVPNSGVSSIIGRGGTEVKRLQEDMGVKVSISNRNEADGITERVCHVSGNVGSVLSACRQLITVMQSDHNLKEHLQDLYSPSVHQGAGGVWGAGTYRAGQGAAQDVSTAVSAEVWGMHCEIFTMIPNAAVGGIIGQKGAVLNEIMQSSGARVQISQKDDLVGQDRRVGISGPLRCVQAAHALVMTRLHEHAGRMDAAAMRAYGSPPQFGASRNYAGGRGAPPPQPFPPQYRRPDAAPSPYSVWEPSSYANMAPSAYSQAYADPAQASRAYAAAQQISGYAAYPPAVDSYNGASAYRPTGQRENRGVTSPWQ